MKFVLLCLSFFCLMVPEVSCGSTFAGDFFIGFPKGAFEGELLRVFITTPHIEAISVTITSLREYSTTTNVRAGTTREITVPSSFEILNGSDYNKGLWIHTSDPNKVISVSVMKNGMYNTVSGSYLALPPVTYPGLHEYVYYISSHYWNNRIPQNYSGSVLLVGNYQNTSVTILPSQNIIIPRHFLSSSYPQGNVNARESYTVLLYRMETLHFDSIYDLTGTKIISNKPLTVLGSHECVDVPVGVAFCDIILEQFPPTVTWGRFFLLTSLHSRLVGEHYKMIGMRHSTAVKVSCVVEGESNPEIDYITMILNFTGDTREFELGRDTFCSVVSNKPIQLIQYSLGYSLDRIGDPFMLLIAPVEQYSNNYTFTAPPNYNNHITITVPLEHYNSSSILLDSAELSGWWPIYCSNSTVCGYGTRTAVQQGTHKVYHSDSEAKLSVSVYGFEYHDGYGLQAGLELDWTADVCQHGDIMLDSSSTEDLSGSIEVCLDGVWTSMCSSEWSTQEASVACQQLGYSPYGAVAYSMQSNKTLWPTIVKDVQCTGSELRLIDCIYSWDVTECTTGQHAYVKCYPHYNVTVEIPTPSPVPPYRVPNPTTLMCRVIVNTSLIDELSIKILWAKENHLLQNTTHYAITDAALRDRTTSHVFLESTLFLYSIKPADNGTYTCLSRVLTSSTGQPLTIQATSSIFMDVVESESRIFQMRFIGVGHCSNWLLQYESPTVKTTQVKEAIVNQIQNRCNNCGFTDNHISDTVFRCFQQDAHHITFHARIYETNQASLGQLLGYLTAWVEQHPFLGVSGVLVNIDTTCEVVVDSFSSEECDLLLETTTVAYFPTEHTPLASISQLPQTESTLATNLQTAQLTDPTLEADQASNSENENNKWHIVIIAGSITIVLVVFIISIACAAVFLSYFKYSIRTAVTNHSVLSTVAPSPLAVYDDPVKENLEKIDLATNIDHFEEQLATFEEAI